MARNDEQWIEGLRVLAENRAFVRPFCSEDLNPFRGKDIQNLRSIISILSKQDRPSLDFGFHENGFWGMPAANHVLNVSCTLGGFLLTEPQMTSALRFLMNPADVGVEKAILHAEAFLHAPPISETKSYDFSPITYEDISKVQNLRAWSEKITKDGKRIDLFMEWTNSDGEECVIVIEAKLGHTLKEGQLPSYSDHVRNELYPRPKKCGFYVLGLSKNASATATKLNDFDPDNNWTVCHWENVLRRWEINLHPYSDYSGTHIYLRRALWQTVFDI